MTELLAEISSSTPARAHRAPAAIHAYRCAICRHPRRKQIEQEFMAWTSPRKIQREHHLPSHNSVYRHAHALGLFDRRRNKVVSTLRRVVERASHARPAEHKIAEAIAMTLKFLASEKMAGRTRRAAGSRNVSA